MLKRHNHEDSVSSLAFLDDARITSGGIDRKIFIIRFEPNTERKKGIKENITTITWKHFMGCLANTEGKIREDTLEAYF